MNKLTSTKSLLPKEYYHLPFCKPEGGKAQEDHENFGELLQGDRIESSPYRLNFKKDLYCEQLCLSNLGRGERKGSVPNKMVSAIHENYQSNWIVDRLGSASVTAASGQEELEFSHGFPIGFVSNVDKKAYVNNHVSIRRRSSI